MIDPLGAALAALRPDGAALRAMTAAFREELARGLSGQPSSLKALPTFARQPRGDERGAALFLDWGGTHGRAGLVELDGRGGAALAREHVFDFGEGDKAAPAARVFDAMAAAVARVAPGSGAIPLGFAYSFPARLQGRDRAIALPLTKGWRNPGLVGEDVAALLAAALARRGAGHIRVAAVVNDTVASLALVSYRARGRGEAPADIGLIAATGTNQAADLGAHGIRNLESGNFDRLAGVAARWDDALDREVGDPAPAAQRFEKMAAGHYLGEIARRVVAELAVTSPRFRVAPGAAAGAPFCLDSAALARVESDRSPALDAAGDILRALSVSDSREDRRAFAAIARAVVERSARLIAAALLGTLAHLDPALAKDHRIAVDGSLYGSYPGFPDLVRAALIDLAGPAAHRIAIDFAKDSTGLGAAILASTPDPTAARA